MDCASCRSPQAPPCGSPNDRGNILRSFMPIRRSTDARPLRPTCSGSSPSPRPPFTKWCSHWNAVDSCAAPQDRPAPLKCSSLPRNSPPCDNRLNSNDQNHWAEGLVVCEEAHRYVPNRGEAQYAAAQDGIRRLAREGRKYGVGLMLVSQRPSDVEETVLSQCNTWLVLRLTNSADQNHVRRLSDPLIYFARNRC